MAKVRNPFNRAADAKRAKETTDKGDGRKGGEAGASHGIARPRELQALEQAARGKQLHQKAVSPGKDNGPGLDR